MNKVEKIAFWLCLILSITIVIIVKPLGNLDEMWNFNVSRCIVDGLVPYKDISMVSTPLLGYLLAIYVINTAEIDMVMFGRTIYPLSYIISALLSVIFTLVISFVMRPKLNRVDMIESLKSVE